MVTSPYSQEIQEPIQRNVRKPERNTIIINPHTASLLTKKESTTLWTGNMQFVGTEVNKGNLELRMLWKLGDKLGEISVDPGREELSARLRIQLGSSSQL